MNDSRPPNTPIDVSRYRGSVTVQFSAALRIGGLEPGALDGRLHGHDFTAEFLFESAILTYPGVVVPDRMRAEIIKRVTDRLHHRDLDQAVGRPATCEAIASYLAAWYIGSTRPQGDPHLLAVTVTTATGIHGGIHLPAPGGTR